MSWKTWKIPVLVLAAAVGATGCDNSPTAPPPAAAQLSASDLASVAVADEVISGAMLNDAMAAAGSLVPSSDQTAGVSSKLTGTFTRTRDCPAGGSVALVGSLTRTRDNDTTTWDVTGTRTRTSCTHSRDSVTIALTGSSSYQAQRMKVSGAWYGEQTSSAQGSFHWVRTDTSTSESAEGDCQFDLKAVRDPDAHTLHVTGTACGKTVDRTVSWNG